MSGTSHDRHLSSAHNLAIAIFAPLNLVAPEGAVLRRCWLLVDRRVRTPLTYSSSHTSSHITSLRMKTHAAAEVSDEDFAHRAERWPRDTPDTKEAYHIREIFDGEYFT